MATFMTLVRERFLLIIVFIYVNEAMNSSPPCPSFCYCKWGISGIKANCKSGFWKTIPPLPFNTTEFLIQNSNIIKLSNSSFSENSTEMIDLRLFSNNISIIETGVFWKMTSLRCLHLNSNKLLTYIPDGIFKFNYNLETLKLTTNKIMDIPKALCDLTSLDSLDLSFNLIRDLNFPWCMKTVNLTTLNLSGNQIVSLTKKSLMNINCKALRKLQIRKCGLKHIQGGVLQLFPLISLLDIAENGLKTFQYATVKGLHYIKNFYIDNNNLIGNFPFEQLQDMMPYLKTIIANNIGMVNFTSPLQFKPNFTVINTLQLDRNRIEHLESNIFTLTGFANVKMLSMDKCKIKTINQNAFVGLQNIKYLSLRSNEFHSIDLKGLKGLSASKIQSIYLDYTPLQDLTADTFSSLITSSLNNISMVGCNISSISNNTFTGLQNLSTVVLSKNPNKNQARRKSLELFENCLSGTFIQELDLSKTNLLEFPSGKFLGNSNLRTLWLQENNINTIIKIHVLGYTYLEYLDLSFNNLEKISQDIFHELPTLKTLKLKANKLTFLEKGMFSKLNALENLDISSNQIRSTSSSEAFLGLKLLKSLSLRDNPQLGENSNHTRYSNYFSDLGNLKYLDLQDCGWKTLPENFFTGLANLETLLLNKNSLKMWEGKVFQETPKLEELQLSHNQLTIVSNNSLHFLKRSLKVIVVQSNPFTCACPNLYFFNWLRNGVLVDYIAQHYSCSSPIAYQGQGILEVPITLKQCESLHLVWVVLGVLSASMVLIVSVASIIHWRWYINYYLFRIKTRTINLFQPVEDHNIYHGFIFYNSNENNVMFWIEQHFLPVLENEAGMKFIYEERNWKYGESVESCIKLSTQKSRYMIIILTNDLLPTLNLKIAITAMKDRLDQIFIILWEEIDADQVPAALIPILTSYRTLRWPGDLQAQARFWKALKQALRKKPELNIPLRDI